MQPVIARVCWCPAKAAKVGFGNQTAHDAMRERERERDVGGETPLHHRGGERKRERERQRQRQRQRQTEREREPLLAVESGKSNQL